MRRSRWHLTPTEKSRCPGCGERLSLLSTDSLGHPAAFWICFDCRAVIEVAVGPVPIRPELTAGPRKILFREGA